MTEIIAANIDTALNRAAQGDLSQIRGKLGQAAREAKNMQAVDEAARDFEAMFVTEMLRPMFDGIEPDPMFGGGKGEEVFQSLMLDEYGKAMVEAGGIGLADHVRAELIRLQEEMKQ